MSRLMKRGRMGTYRPVYQQRKDRQKRNNRLRNVLLFGMVLGLLGVFGPKLWTYLELEIALLTIFDNAFKDHALFGGNLRVFYAALACIPLPSLIALIRSHARLKMIVLLNIMLVFLGFLDAWLPMLVWVYILHTAALTDE